jgi:serine/threonine protein phosphatase 1
MRTLAIGDIHGCLHALDALLALVRPQPDDLVITLGDYTDRGPDSRGVIDRLLHLRDECRVVCLRGNHDQMLLEARHEPATLWEWLHFGGRQTLESYAKGSCTATLFDIPELHWTFLEATLPYYETDTHIFVHGRLDPHLPLDEQPSYLLYWEKLDKSVPIHDSGKKMICGHTAQRTGVPLDLGHAVCIDTFVYGTGWLTCLDVGTGEVWQARQTGVTRIGRLGEPLAEIK